MRRILLLYIFISPFAAYTQQYNPALFSKHTFYVECAGLNPYFLGYENIINPESPVKIMFGFAGAYYKATEDNTFFTIKVYNGVLAGKAPFYAGLNLNFVQEAYTYRNIHRNDDLGLAVSDEKYLVPEFNIRYQPVKRGLYAAIAFSYTYDNLFSISNYIDNPILSWQFGRHFVSPSVKLGYTFKTGKVF